MGGRAHSPDPGSGWGPKPWNPADSVGVEVMSPVQARSWDVRIFFENGEQNAPVRRRFHPADNAGAGAVGRASAPRLQRHAHADREQPGKGGRGPFETVDLWGVTRTDNGHFQIRSSDAMVFDHNLFRPGVDGASRIRFKISSMRPVVARALRHRGGS